MRFSSFQLTERFTNLFKIEGDYMKTWWQKTLVVAVALLTFGAISPDHMIWENLLDDKGQEKQASTQRDAAYELGDWTDPAEYWVTEAVVVETIRQSAEEQSYIKFGSRIGPVIGDQFQQVVLPNMQRAIEDTLARLDDRRLRSLSVSEKPAGDHSEKIFHVFDTETGKDLLRFHVRTDKKPLEGYSFNFHYHVAEDGFSSHIPLGDIYWSKNTPPKWLS